MGHAAPWKGAVVIIASFAAALLVSYVFSIDSALIAFVASILTAGIVGGALKLNGRQIAVVIIGSILGGAVVLFVADVAT